ncbi:MAG: hypothetical protein ACEQSU_08220 [Microgenomates group bacterium]
MKTKALTAAQIDTLARLLATRIGVERVALDFNSIMTAATAEQAEARLTLVLDYGDRARSSGCQYARGSEVG